MNTDTKILSRMLANHIQGHRFTPGVLRSRKAWLQRPGATSLVQTMALGDKLESLLDHTFLLISVLIHPIHTSNQQSDEQEFCQYWMSLLDT